MAVDLGLSSAIVTGRHYVLNRYWVDETSIDFRPTNMRANLSVPDKVEVVYSLVDNYFSNVRTCRVWIPEAAHQIACKLVQLPLSERFETAKQLSARVTNLMVDSTVYFDAMNGSAVMAVFIASSSDVSEGICRRMQGDLNYQGAPGLWRMVSVTAPAILVPSLLLAAIPLALSCTRVSLRLVGAAFSRFI